MEPRGKLIEPDPLYIASRLTSGVAASLDT